LPLSYGFSEINLVPFQKFEDIDGITVSKDLDDIQQLIDAFKNNGFNKPIYFSVSGKSNFNPSSKSVKVNLKFPSNVKYTPL